MGYRLGFGCASTSSKPPDSSARTTSSNEIPRDRLSCSFFSSFQRYVLTPACYARVCLLSSGSYDVDHSEPDPRAHGIVFRALLQLHPEIWRQLAHVTGAATF